jgi:hypothetical protein
MELREKPLPIDMRLLGREAGRAQAFAKCLKYKEREFHADPSPDCVEALIGVYNQLGLREAASGVLRGRGGMREDGVEGGALRPGWLEKIAQWEKALVLYETYGKGYREEMKGKYHHDEILLTLISLFPLPQCPK